MPEHAEYGKNCLIISLSRPVVWLGKNDDSKVDYREIAGLPLMPKSIEELAVKIFNIWVPACRCHVHLVLLAPGKLFNRSFGEFWIGPYLKETDRLIVGAESGESTRLITGLPAISPGKAVCPQCKKSAICRHNCVGDAPSYDEYILICPACGRIEMPKAQSAGSDDDEVNYCPFCGCKNFDHP